MMVGLALVFGCGDDDGPECAVAADCEGAELCVDGTCMAPTDSGTSDGFAPDAPESCGPGQIRDAASCVDECGDPSAMPCESGQVCDVSGGRCVDEGTAGLLPATETPCGDGLTCGPGTECSVDGQCDAIPACGRRVCDASESYCWGRGCVYDRPAGSCSPPTLERMNMDDFLLGGDGGAIDLEFDEVCNAYAVTMISGTDYLRQLEPDGTLTVSNGVTNLNMGEVAVLRPIGGEFGGGAEDPGEVALTYICCATCGCVGSDPQGVARLDREGPTSLPMVVEATPSTGTAPWGSAALDTGPYGLTWGRDRTLFVGNVSTNGDLVRASLDEGTSEELHRFEARVLATTVYNRSSLVVALEGGELWLASTATDSSASLTTVDGEVTSLVRDPLTGHLFVSLGDGRVLELEADGTAVGTFHTFDGPVRIARSPDGFLYALDPGFPRPGAITRMPLPATRE